MDIKAVRKDGETKFELVEDMSLWRQRNKRKQLCFKSLQLTKNENGQSMFLVEFDNGLIWMPKWDDEVHFIWCYAFLTELNNWLTFENNKSNPKRYDPEKQFVKPILDFLNNEVCIWDIKFSKTPIGQSTKLMGSKSN